MIPFIYKMNQPSLISEARATCSAAGCCKAGEKAGKNTLALSRFHFHCHICDEGAYAIKKQAGKKEQRLHSWCNYGLILKPSEVKWEKLPH